MRCPNKDVSSDSDQDQNGNDGDGDGDGESKNDGGDIVDTKERSIDAENEGGGVGAIVGASISAVVVAVILILAFIFFRKRRTQKRRVKETPSLGNVDEMKTFEVENNVGVTDEDDQLVNEIVDECICEKDTDEKCEKSISPVPIAEFISYVNMLKTNKNYEFHKEFDTLPKVMKASSEVAKKPFNKEKNRYKDIVTYDHSRVILSGNEDSDYINASYINPKCEKYWPGKGSVMFGDIEVTLLKTEEFSHYVMRTLQIKRDDEEREVRHFHFLSWPDHGVPKYPTQLLAFRRLFRTYHLEDSGPCVVHCSAGVGRTGVFLAIDTILEKFEKDMIDFIDVYGQVYAMRKQRMMMVQTLTAVADSYVMSIENFMELIGRWEVFV
ncbi:receptor-type tyrosine-protein phosphatase S-like [Dendronephthya gigantea]|uniref:receptor-type tyrosine-protein phosphatase S-like n=1 Tax=Dendronephthya gigantea TaxID=151771 RepID=UPI00106CAD5E|nr:receptor-type tyrosine-protein phosphatase S-like [Dendronephthya gigantea]